MVFSVNRTKLAYKYPKTGIRARLWSNANVNIALPVAGLEGYTSRSQLARIGTEAWAALNLYCPSCDSPRISPFAKNMPAADFSCPMCHSTFQLKSQRQPLKNRIVDSAYSTMRKAIVEDRTPNLYLMHYDQREWSVRTLILIPQFALSLSAIECRKPLAATARRAGWIGCNILLDQIPRDARIPVIDNGVIVSSRLVRQAFKRLRSLKEIRVEARGWTLEVLNLVRSLGRDHFSLSEVYAHSEALSLQHPRNLHVKAKIRQQLQVLRDLGLVRFLERGEYAIVSRPPVS